MRSFSFNGLKHYLTDLGEFTNVTVRIFESSSHCYTVCLHRLSDLEKLPPHAIFNVDCTKTVN